ncbi:MAG: hypothetical protein IIT81_01930, partial [Mycoplasmataceae bacterium]|nr:hypothetical protein [Mycoplasmataceae bacterium]
MEQDINVAMLKSSNGSSSLFSDLTASQALLTIVVQSSSAATGSSSEQTYNLNQAILYVLQNEILSKYPNGFNVEGVSYTLSEVINNISLKLPSTITPTQNANAQIPITLSYNSIELKNTSGSTSFIVDGFSTNMSSSNQAVVDELKSLLQQDINVSQYFSTSASQTLLNDPGSNSANIDWNELMSLQNSILKGSDHKSQITLIQAILITIYNEITSKYNSSLVIDNVTYSISQIMNAISVNLPSTISSSDNAAGEIPITLSYNSIELENTSNSTTFIVDGFITDISIQNNEVIAKLASILNEDIDVSTWFSKFTAAQAIKTDSLTNSTSSTQTTLNNAVLNVIEDEITNKYSTGFTINDVTYSIANIIKNIVINIPLYIPLTENTGAEISNVTILYNSLQLSNQSGTNTFTITGFETVSAAQTGINDNRNQQIVTKLDSLLQQNINVYQWFSNNTASQALQTYEESLSNSTSSNISI